MKAVKTSLLALVFAVSLLYPVAPELAEAPKPKPASETTMLKIENILLKITLQQKVLQELSAERDRIAAEVAAADGVTVQDWTLDLQSRTWTPKPKAEKK